MSGGNPAASPVATASVPATAVSDDAASPPVAASLGAKAAAEGGDDPMHSDLLGDGEFWDAWTTFYLREPGDGVLLGTRPRDEFLKLLFTRFNVDASVPCTCKANVNFIKKDGF